MTQTHTDDVSIDDLETFLRDYYQDDIGQLAEHYPREQRSLHIDYDDLFMFNPEFAREALEQPKHVRELLEEALRRYDLPVDIGLSQANVRLRNLPDALNVAEVSRHSNLGHLINVSGQVAKVSTVKPRLETGHFECQRCGMTTDLPQHGDKYQEPHECQGCERQGPFRLVPNRSEWTNHQHARVQEPPERTKGGNAQHVDVHLEDDLTETFEAGDRIELAGVLDVQEPTSDQDRTFDTSLSGHSVHVEETDYEDIEVDEYLDEIEAIANGDRGDPYDLLVESINPKHEGDEDIKLAIALQMFGGWAHEHPDGSRDRGDSHILLLGDPGCGKSTFLRAVDNLAPRSTYSSGKGASAAGMTAAAVKDDFGDGSQWALEAGALVLSDRGIACVDEIDKMQDDAVSSMHDALEGQRVHVNKAGIEATLSARTALLAAGNPKHGRFDPHQPLGQQIDLGPTLLSRFDLMFMVSDQPDEQRDANVVEHMIEGRQASGKYTLGEDLADDELNRIQPAIPREVLRAYIAHAKQMCYPVLRDDDVKAKLTNYFVQFRNSGGGTGDSPVPVTYRKVEGIQRLAEASARIRLDDEVRMEDVQRTINLVEKSMRQVGYDPEAGEFDADIVETGASMNQRDRRRMFLNVVEELEEENSKGAVRSKVIERMTAVGHAKSKVETDIRHFKDKGEIWETSTGHIRTS